MMTKRDKLAGWQHGIELTVALIGFFGWLWWKTHPAKQFTECDCKRADHFGDDARVELE